MLVPHVTYGRAACGINHLYIRIGSLHFTSELIMVFKLQQGASIIRYVGRSVGRSVGQSVRRSVEGRSVVRLVGRRSVSQSKVGRSQVSWSVEGRSVSRKTCRQVKSVGQLVVRSQSLPPSKTRRSVGRSFGRSVGLLRSLPPRIVGWLVGRLVC